MREEASNLAKPEIEGAFEDADMVVRPESLTEQVYKAIKRRVTGGIYPAGYHLVERTLAKEFRISKTPVREALARLEREGLAVNVPGKGIVVRELSLDEIKDILEIREILEGFAARKAAGVLSAGQLMELHTALEKGKAAVSRGDLAEYKECDIQFHSIIRNAAGNTKACEIVGALEDQIRLVMTTSVTLPGRSEDSLKCHQEILSALEKGDADLAEACARKHIRNVREAIIKHWLERGQAQRG